MRPSLAEQAVYVYSRGGQNITGPSIRLAEAAARAWGNLKYGFRVTGSDKLHSEVVCYAYDIEANIPVERSFMVSHIRHTKAGDKLLTDPRDIYEKVANEAMRRVRACILECIPGDIIESAVEQCEQTLSATADITPATLKKLVDAFDAIGVTKVQIEARIQRRIDAIAPAQVIDLRKIYTSIKDGMSKAEDWFATNIVDASAEPSATPSGQTAKKSSLAETAAKYAKSASGASEAAEGTNTAPATSEAATSES